MRQQAEAAGAGMGGRYRPGGGAAGARARNGGPFDGVRINIFDIFRFSPGNRENLGVPKARWRNILVKLDVSLEELLSGVVKEVDVSVGAFLLVGMMLYRLVFVVCSSRRRKSIWQRNTGFGTFFEGVSFGRFSPHTSDAAVGGLQARPCIGRKERLRRLGLLFVYY